MGVAWRARHDAHKSTAVLGVVHEVAHNAVQDAGNVHAREGVYCLEPSDVRVRVREEVELEKGAVGWRRRRCWRARSCRRERQRACREDKEWLAFTHGCKFHRQCPVACVLVSQRKRVWQCRGAASQKCKLKITVSR